MTQQNAGNGRQAPTVGSADDVDGLHRQEAVLGESDAGRAICKALQAVARAARAFLFYDPSNDAVTAFLEEMRQQLSQALRHGDMVLVIRPWQILKGDEVVYRDQDRERSLSFRLYRDGVRQLTIKPGLSWDEAVRLLGVFSVRYTGVRQQEDDIVTLLWRARFEHIEVQSVECVEPEDDEIEELTDGQVVPRTPKQATIFDAPYRFHHPWPRYEQLAELRGQDISPQQLSSLQAEDEPGALAGQCVRLVEELLRSCADPLSGMDLDSLLAQLREIRTHLIDNQAFAELLAVLKLALLAPLAADGAFPRGAVLQVFIEPRALQQLVASVLEEESPSPAISEMLRFLPGEAVATVLQLLSQRWEEPARTMGMELLADLPEARLAPVLAMAQKTSGSMAADLLRTVASYHKQHAVPLALVHLQGDSAEVKRVALAILKKAQYSSEIGKVLIAVLDDPEEEVRTSAAILLAMNFERRAYEVIVRGIEARGPAHLSPKEGEAMGMVLAKLEPRRALGLFREWSKPSGLLGTLKAGKEQLAWAAVCGLAMIPGSASEEIVRLALKKADGELRQRCNQTMTVLRRYAGRRKQ